MKLKNTLQLAWQSLKNDKKRSFLTILTMGIIFTVVFAANFWLQGIENTYLRFAGEKTYGLVSIPLRELESFNTETGEVSFKELSADFIESEKSRLISEVEMFGGQYLDVVSYDNQYNLILPKGIIKEYIEIDLSSAPSEATPILITDDKIDSWQQTLENNSSAVARTTKSFEARLNNYQSVRSSYLGQTVVSQEINYYIVGFAPDGFSITDLSYEYLQKGQYNILDPILKLITTPKSRSIVFDATSSKENNSAVLNLLFSFDSRSAARNYLQSDKVNSSSRDHDDSKADFSIIIGADTDFYSSMSFLHLALDVISAFLVVVALTIIIFTSIRLVDNDQKVIALYRSLGASSRQIRVIYLARFFLLSLFATLSAFFLALIALLIYSRVEQSHLSTIFTLAFSLSEAPNIVILGLNWEIAVIAMISLLASPLLAVFSNLRRLK